ncbi:jg3352 [Pararge aegeria aegeria]|uniref:Jg3352 protein n=1 Tax=Pararge aegeria aegeria TaxID=348720 RepID=A0A8S4RSA6_9NEOP|nr:jg3352 [Pararge aegeria aegeria]
MSVASPRRRVVAPTRPGIFDANFGIALTADYADGVREGSHPKAETRAGRAGVIARLGPRAARSRRTHNSSWAPVRTSGRSVRAVAERTLPSSPGRNSSLLLITRCLRLAATGTAW